MVRYYLLNYAPQRPEIYSKSIMLLAFLEKYVELCYNMYSLVISKTIPTFKKHNYCNS